DGRAGRSWLPVRGGSGSPHHPRQLARSRRSIRGPYARPRPARRGRRERSRLSRLPPGLRRRRDPHPLVVLPRRRPLRTRMGARRRAPADAPAVARRDLAAEPGGALKAEAIRLGILTTHPVQYQVPWFRALAREPGIDLTVL